MKGIILAGGLGTRLRPLTNIINKNLLPIYDRPLIDFSLQTLVDAGIEDIMIVSGSEQIGNFVRYLGSGSSFGGRIVYEIQENPLGIPHAISYAEKFVQHDNCAVVLSDNIFLDQIKPAVKKFREGAHVFLKKVPDPERFGIAQIKDKKITRMIEKPKRPKSNLAVTGLYLFDPSVFKIIRKLKPSKRGEYEIVDVLNAYLARDELTHSQLRKEWIDAGTFESMYAAATLIRKKFS